MKITPPVQAYMVAVGSAYEDEGILWCGTCGNTFLQTRFCNKDIEELEVHALIRILTEHDCSTAVYDPRSVYTVAANMQCDGPDDEGALLVITNIAEAETVALCAGCALDWALALVQAAAPEMIAKPPAKGGRRRKAVDNGAAESGEQETGGGTGEGDKTEGEAARVD